MPSSYGGSGPRIMTLGWVFCVITSTLMAMRVYVRLKLSPKGTWALFWTAVAYMSTTLELIFASVACHYGLGNHIEVVAQAGNTSSFLFWTWLACFFFDINLALGKLAAASLLLAVHEKTRQDTLLLCAAKPPSSDALQTPDPKRRFLLHFIAASNVLICVADGLLVWLHCDPPSALWNPLEQSKCKVKLNADFTRFVSVLALIPTLLVWPLQMARRLKFGVGFLMGLGVFAALSSFMVTYNLKALEHANDPGADPSHDLTDLMLWGKATTWLVLIAASVPPVWPLFKPLTVQFAGPARGQPYQPSANITLTKEHGTAGRLKRVESGGSEEGLKSTNMTTVERVASDSSGSLGRNVDDLELDHVDRAYLGRHGSV